MSDYSTLRLTNSSQRLTDSTVRLTNSTLRLTNSSQRLTDSSQHLTNSTVRLTNSSWVIETVHTNHTRFESQLGSAKIGASTADTNLRNLALQMPESDLSWVLESLHELQTHTGRGTLSIRLLKSCKLLQLCICIGLGCMACLPHRPQSDWLHQSTKLMTHSPYLILLLEPTYPDYWNSPVLGSIYSPFFKEKDFTVDSWYAGSALGGIYVTRAILNLLQLVFAIR